MILYLVRHAWAGEYGDPRYPNDAYRPLSDDGRKRFQKMAKMLVERGMAPAAIATSPLLRCRQTADILAELAPGVVEMVELDELAPGSKLNELVQWTQRRTDVDVAWVGHAPDVGDLAAALVGLPDGNIHFSKGAVAAIQFADDVAPGMGELRWLVTAKVLGC